MADTMQYLSVPDKHLKRRGSLPGSKRDSLPGSKLRKIVAIKSLHDQGLRHNKSQSDLEYLQLSTVWGNTKKNRHVQADSPAAVIFYKNQSKSSSSLAENTHKNGRRDISPIITVTVPKAKMYELNPKRHNMASHQQHNMASHQHQSTTPMASKSHKDKFVKKHKRNSSLPEAFLTSIVGRKVSTASQLPVTSDLSMTSNTVTTTTPGPSTDSSETRTQRAASMRQREYSPLTGRRSLGGENSSSDSHPKLKMVHTTEGALNYSSTSPSDFQGHMTAILADDDENGESNGGDLGSGGSDITEDVVDGSSESDPQRKAAIRQLNEKIFKTMQHIKNEQKTKEENVNEYLRLSTNADKAQAARIKTLFEKRNTKSTQNIRHLQLKLENYKKRLREVEAHGVTGPRKAKEVMKDMGQGLKVLFTREARSRDTSPSRPRDVGANIREGISGFSGGVVDNIRGAKDSIVSKPKEFVHLVKNKFGSADNINAIKSLEDTQGSTDDNADKNSYVGGGGTLPSGYHFPTSGQSEDLDEVISTVSSESHRSGGVHSGGIHSGGVHSNSGPPHHHSLASSDNVVSKSDLGVIIQELSLQRQANERLSEEIASLRSELMLESESTKQLLEEERYRMERVEEQVNDLTELHQHEVTNIKQELQSMEEKMEYQLGERTRDMQELLESCQTRITKMELQQQQQQLISMEGFDNSNFRNLVTKLINVVLAILAVLLVLVSTIAQFLGPFLTTRVRILSTIFLVVAMVLVWQNWNQMTDLPHRLVDYVTGLLPNR